MKDFDACVMLAYFIKNLIDENGRQYQEMEGMNVECSLLRKKSLNIKLK
jgi:hypothetical protein